MGNKIRERNWTDDDAATVNDAWTARLPLVEIAETVDRPVSEVVTRLVRDGILFYSHATQAFHICAPVITMAEIQKLDDEMERRK